MKRTDQHACEACGDVSDQRAVADTLDPGLHHGIKVRKQTRIHVEVWDQDRPQQQQHRKGRKEQERSVKQSPRGTRLQRYVPSP